MFGIQDDLDEARAKIKERDNRIRELEQDRNDLMFKIAKIKLENAELKKRLGK